MKLSAAFFALLFATLFFLPAPGHADAVTVLWWNTLPDNFETPSRARQEMADYLDDFDGGDDFTVTYQFQQREGSFAAFLQSAQFDIVILDMATTNPRFNTSDIEAIKAHYARGSRALMLDGTLGIRNINAGPETRFPGRNGSSAAMLVNQVSALAKTGGGILIGADHDRFQVGANQVLAALVPGAQFQGLTNPSTNGEFIGDTLLGERVPVTAADMLGHWESVPNQGEAPVGQFTDFLGQAVQLYPLIEAADKPGAGPQRPYISASFDPGDRRTAIDSDAAFEDNMPTRVGPSSNQTSPSSRP